VPDETGRIEPSTTGTTGITGRWFASADTEDCQKRGKHAARECSLFIAPDPRAPTFRPTGDLGMCTMGVVAKVLLGSDGRMDWGNMTGASIGVTLDDGAPYDAPAHGVTGLAFHIDTQPPPGGAMLVELATETSRAGFPWWGGGTGDASPVRAGDNQFRWSDVGGPLYVENPPRFDPTRLLSISFHVRTDPAGAKAFSFCISHLAALTD
jgi:hypothetical protein